MLALCKHCKEPIEVGDACRTEGVNGNTKFFHTGCHLQWREQQEATATEAERVADLARTVH